MPEVPKTSVSFDEADLDFVGPPRPLDDETIEKVAEVMRPLDQPTRDKVVSNLNRQFAEADAKMRSARVKRQERIEATQALEALNEWFGQITRFQLERNDCSRLHAFKEALQSERVIGGSAERVKLPIINDLQHTFVIQHDWAAAFEGSQGIDGNHFRLPYGFCAFEFRVSGRSVILLAKQEADELISYHEFFESRGYWWGGPDEVVGGRDFLIKEVGAICIALDAEVATHSVVRAPHKLNEKRERAGKTKLLDYHVVDLARRHRISNPVSAGTGSRKRLHFRRGHWRHFETSKTWVKWCLVGDPDLGFIQKSYKL